MAESQRLKDLHEVIDKMLDGCIRAGRETKRDRRVENLISIYRDILAIDGAAKKDDWERVQEIIQYAYVVNGGVDIFQAGPDTYQLFFAGQANNENGKRDILRLGLEIHNRHIKFTDYELL